MKKLLFILFVVMGLGLSAQSVMLEKVEQARIDTMTITTDSLITIPVSPPYSGVVQFTWAAAAGTTNATFRLRQSADSLQTWPYMAGDSVTMDAAAGYAAFQIAADQPAQGDRVAIMIRLNSCTSTKFIYSTRLWITR